MYRLRVLVLSLVAAGMSACAAGDAMRPARESYSAGDFAAANAETAALVEKNGSNVHLYQLEHGITSMAAGQPDAAISAWRAARDRLDSLSGRGMMESLASWLSDESALDFEGAAFERVLVLAFMSLAELIAPDRMFGNDALAFALQVGERQRQIIEEWQKGRDDLGGQSLVDPKAAFKLVSFGSYMVAMVREADPLTMDEAEREMQKVVDMEPDRPWLRAELERIERRHFAAAGKGVVYVIGMVGRGPYRVEGHVDGSQQAFQLAQVIVGASRRRFPQISVKGVPIDELAFHADNPDALGVIVDGRDAGRTDVVTDIEQVARQEYQATRGFRIARALIRRAIKVGIVEASREVVAHNDKGGRRNGRGRRQDRSAESAAIDLGLAAIGSLWQATEVADLRCWSLLPASCQVLRLELDEGSHEIVVQPERGGRRTGQPQTIRVDVRAGWPTYVLAVCPTDRGAAPLLSRQLSIATESAAGSRP